MSSRLIGGGLAFVIVVLLALDLRHQAGGRARVLVGQPAPAFDLPLLGGGRVSPGALRGHPVVLAFWATWCGPCRAELPSLDRLHHRFTGARFVAVNIEDAAMRTEVEAFVRETALSLPVALDGAAVSNLYKVSSIPQLVIIDAEGTIREVLSGGQSERTVARALTQVGEPPP